MKNPLVSVIITTYNRSKFLHETISSMAHQTYKNVEILLIDDGSSPNIALENKKICEGFAKCEYHYKANTGQPDSRNYGIKKAKGAYIAFCDDDDYWALDKLEKQVKILNTFQDFDIVSGTVEIVNDKSEKTGSKKTYKGINHGYIFENTLRRNCVSSATPLLRKSVFDKTGYFNPDFTIGEDREFWRRASYFHKFYAIEDTIAYYRVHNTNMSKKKTALETFLLYRKLTNSLLKWGEPFFSDDEKNKIDRIEWQVFRKLLVNHFPSLKAKLNFLFKIVKKDIKSLAHMVFLYFKFELLRR